MRLFALEHGKVAYYADFALYGSALAVLTTLLLVAGPRGQAAGLCALVLLGLCTWSLMEYLVHRFILHGMQPFRRWHAEHHRRPTALVGAPTVLSAMLFVMLVFLPAAALAGRWQACALLLGVLIGYQSYAMTHHAIHLWRSNQAWLQRRRRWHGLHHRRGGQATHYGVTTAFWDQLFGSDERN
ncbi:Fatty acid hydroxylase superfamily protein [Solimonas aquatica]|uniref:Fatty acid hydroxylase superfamily protein n=1 Tax=Solimonas aquatica TaxID=489703 RepID=A0A1H9FTD2_9GAMM|nr:sterol desaturase family protein [Solimonas aquatica]SEQ41180.1 Fatty acid hydroxylase superfamily protein [Solimonas aquatica]